MKKSFLIYGTLQLLQLLGSGATLPRSVPGAISGLWEVTVATTTDQITEFPTSSVPDFTSNDVEENENEIPEEFPDDGMDADDRLQGGLVVHFLLFAYCCLALAIVCDQYLLPALQFVSDALKLPPNIAGATFLAIGTSAPELFTSIMGVFVTDDDIGTGTILGTAIFKLPVIAACGVVAAVCFKDRTLTLTPFPILRDTIYYVITLMTLMIVIKDNQVDWIEALILIILFFVYLFILFLNTQDTRHVSLSYSTRTAEKLDARRNDVNERKRSASMSFSTATKDNNEKKRNESISISMVTKAELAKSVFDKADAFEVSFKKSNSTNEERFTDFRLMKYICWPLLFVFKYTIPKPSKCWSFAAFGVSILWISGLTYLCVWMITVIDLTLQIPQAVAGLTILGAGTSVPEVITSVLVVKKYAQADMAISNAIASNIFDILFCLGIPWLLKSLINWNTTASVTVESGSLPVTVALLAFAAVAMLIAFKMRDWTLRYSIAIACLVIYAVFIAAAINLELFATSDLD